MRLPIARSAADSAVGRKLVSNIPLLGPGVVALVVLAFRAAAKNGRSGSPARGAGPAPVPVDHDHGDPELVTLRKAVGRADWDATAAILQPYRDRGDHSRLAWLISCASQRGGDFLLEVGSSRADDPLARTVAGARHVDWAWEARTGARASQVSREQFELFHQRLRTAEEHLYAAVELDPESASPWCFLTTASMGLQHGPEVTRRRFEAGTRRAPSHLAMHTAMLQEVCAKWHGSHEEMHAFARESLAKAEPGSGLGALIAQAHLEHWLDLPKDERTGYIRGGDVVQELREAAAASVLHPAYAPTASPYPALNAFAMAFWLAGDTANARQMFERIGDHPTRLPWGYAGNPGQVFARARQECKKAKKAK